MTMPGFSAETSLYRTSIQYSSTWVLVQAGGAMPQLFCRVTDCPCQYEQCRKAGGTVVPGPQPPCFYTCEVKPGCTCKTGETCCNPFTNFCCPPGETCCNPETKFCCRQGQTPCCAPGRNFCCPPGQLCCDPENNVCCPTGTVCCGGGCCAPPHQCCGTSCTDIKTDPVNCGFCGNVCGRDQICANGQCVCPPGLAPCLGGCVDLRADSFNCGTCGNACGPGQTCVNGQCCKPCGGVCCQPGQTCVNGVCSWAPFGCAVCNDGSCPCGNQTGAQLCASHGGVNPTLGCIQQEFRFPLLFQVHRSQ